MHITFVEAEYVGNYYAIMYATSLVTTSLYMLLFNMALLPVMVSVIRVNLDITTQNILFLFFYNEDYHYRFNNALTTAWTDKTDLNKVFITIGGYRIYDTYTTNYLLRITFYF